MLLVVRTGFKSFAQYNLSRQALAVFKKVIIIIIYINNCNNRDRQIELNIKDARCLSGHWKAQQDLNHWYVIWHCHPKAWLQATWLRPVFYSAVRHTRDFFSSLQMRPRRTSRRTLTSTWKTLRPKRRRSPSSPSSGSSKRRSAMRSLSERHAALPLCEETAAGGGGTVMMVWHLHVNKFIPVGTAGVVTKVGVEGMQRPVYHITCLQSCIILWL